MKNEIFRSFIAEAASLSPHSVLEPQAHGNGVVDGGHGFGVEVAHFVAEAFFIDGAHLLEQDHGVLGEADAFGGEIDVGREAVFPEAAGDGGGDDGGAVSVADVVLDDEDGPDSSLFAAHDGAEIGVIDIAAFDCHFPSFLSDDILGRAGPRG